MTSHSNRGSGFTLLEMVVVIAVLGLVMGMLAEYGPFQSHWLTTRAAAEKIADTMAQDHGRAIATGQPITLKLPPLPDWLLVNVAAPAGGIVFQPDGSATAARIVLNDGSRQITLATDWLTGQVHLDAN